jgi:hypothetical protein
MSTREDYAQRAKVYWQNYYGQLEGVTITKYLGKDEDGFPTFQVKYPNGEYHEIQVSCDPEGNGEGFLFLPYEPDLTAYDKAHKLNDYEVA